MSLKFSGLIVESSAEIRKDTCFESQVSSSSIWIPGVSSYAGVQIRFVCRNTRAAAKSKIKNE